jgi:two-component sensor histidine kinase
VALSTQAATTPKELSAAVQSRLMALARAHALTLPDLSARDPSAKETITLHALIQTILAPYDGPTTDSGARVAISGPDISVGGGSLTNLALLLHEFATNAAKYGALSTPAGRIDIRCHEDNGQFHLTWTERGGPCVDHQKNGEGFGTLLARAAAKGPLGGEISRDWKPEGLTMRLSIARDHVSA